MPRAFQVLRKVCIVRMRGAIPLSLLIFAFFASAALFVLIKCPPLWRDYDGLIQISSRPSDMTILQYPAAYPLFSRLHIYAAQIVHARMRHIKASINIRKGVKLNDAGLYALIVSQQTALALALTFFVYTCTQTLTARLGVMLLLISNASLFVIANLVSTEALSEVIVIVLVALGLALFRSETQSRLWVASYAFCLYAAIMTRHTNAIFAMIVPTAYFFRTMVQFLDTRRFVIGQWRPMAIFVLIGFVCIGASNLTTRVLCRAFDVEYRSINARATSERLGFVNQMQATERGEFLASLQARSDDPVVREAIPMLARSESWVNQRAEIQKILLRRSPGIDDKSLASKSDAYLNVVSGLFFRSLNRHLIANTIDSIRRALVSATVPDVSGYYLKTAVWSLDLYVLIPDFHEKTKSLQVCSIDAKEKINSFSSMPWLWLWKWPPFGGIFMAVSLAALGCLICRIGDPRGHIFALALSATGTFSTCLTFVLVNYIPRFAANADLFAFLSLAVLIGNFRGSRLSGEIKTSNRPDHPPREVHAVAPSHFTG